MTVQYLDLLKLAGPETVLVCTVLAVLAADLLALRGTATRLRFIVGGAIATAGCLVAGMVAGTLPEHASFMHGMLVIDPLSVVLKWALLGLAVFSIWLSVDTVISDHVGEYLALILLATIGMMFLVSTHDVLMIFVALELTSLSLYILTAFNKRNPKSAEAALKYFLFGGISAAFTLFGLSFVYGLSNSTHLPTIAAALAGPGLDPLLALALVMTLIGFGFKVAAVPFHLWAPDAYEGAPLPSAALIASGSKVASFVVLAKIVFVGFAGVGGAAAWGQFRSGWLLLVAVLAALSMVVGNLAAIVQPGVRRLLAYSAIAHAGYVLISLLAAPDRGLAALCYYVITYGLATVGAFGVVSFVQNHRGDDRLAGFAGLSRRSPLVAFCLAVFLLSLAGIPPLSGFFGKFYVFAAALQRDQGLLWLVLLALAMSAVSLYYYLQVLKQAFVVPAEAVESRASADWITQLILVILAGAVLVLGCFPGLLVKPVASALGLAV
jgi:NADH-quinone oxidoreductase subunit N